MYTFLKLNFHLFANKGSLNKLPCFFLMHGHVSVNNIEWEIDVNGIPLCIIFPFCPYALNFARVDYIVVQWHVSSVTSYVYRNTNSEISLCISMLSMIWRFIHVLRPTMHAALLIGLWASGKCRLPLNVSDFLFPVGWNEFS